MKTLSTKQGFTIIEVVLVLAIAGLIFLMVFIALPALQRSQRDTQRRSDMARVATALTNWQTNHNNNLPSNGTSSTNNAQAKTLLVDYLKGRTDDNKSEFADPSGSNYTITVTDDTSTAVADRPTVTIITGAQCGNNGSPTSGSASEFAVLYKSEGSGTICVDNQ